jgi:hypothetical protein
VLLQHHGRIKRSAEVTMCVVALLTAADVVFEQFVWVLW